MLAVLPLLGGLVLGRFAPTRLAVLIQVLFYTVAAVTLVVTAPAHHSSHPTGLIAAFVLAPLSVGTLLGGMSWRRRTQPSPATRTQS